MTTLPPPERTVATAITRPPERASRSRKSGDPHAGSDGRPATWKIRTRSAPYLFLAPYFITTAVFFLYPLAYATVLAFYQTNGPATKAFVGMDNFRFVLSDPDFHAALWNTTVFACCSIGIQLPLSLGLAMLLNAKHGRSKAVLRLVIFAPNLVGQVFVAILFQMLFTPRYGLLNRLVHGVTGWGLEQRWLSDPSLVMPAIVIASLWLWVGFNMVYFLAALQSVDQSLVEAARIDGAGPARVFWNVTLPAIRPVATFVVVTSTIGSFQLFELPYTLLQGAPLGNAGRTVVWYLYTYAFENGDLGTAAAVGWLLTVIVMGINFAQLKLSGTGKE